MYYIVGHFPSLLFSLFRFWKEIVVSSPWFLLVREFRIVRYNCCFCQHQFLLLLASVEIFSILFKLFVLFFCSVVLCFLLGFVVDCLVFTRKQHEKSRQNNLPTTSKCSSVKTIITTTTNAKKEKIRLKVSLATLRYDEESKQILTRRKSEHKHKQQQQHRQLYAFTIADARDLNFLQCFFLSDFVVIFIV